MKNNRVIINILILILVFFIASNVYADDYPDDIYDGDYSIEDMLKNYNVVTFGKQGYNPNVQYQMYSGQGTLQLYHSNGNVLVNGDVGSMERLDSTNLSYVNGSIRIPIKHGYGKIYSSSSQIGFCSSYPKCYNQYSYNASYTTVGNYINFDRLYENILEQQKKIKKGKKIETNDDTLHLSIGGEYYIDDISSVHDIIFDNFEDNKDELTIITINNSNSINFPQLFVLNDEHQYQTIPTNDYLGMTRPNNDYSRYFVNSTYYGNIIWNFPNANYIRFRTGVPIVGHIIAPNADVEGPELHFAGTFLVNGLSLSGHSEAHFYPLTSTNIPYRSNPELLKAKMNMKKSQGNIRFFHNVNNESIEEGMVVSFKVEAESDYLLSGMEIKDDEENIIEFKEIGDGEYEFTMPATNVTITPKFVEKNIKNTIEQIITNPKTKNNFFILLGIIIVSFIVGYKKIKKENKI